MMDDVEDRELFALGAHKFVEYSAPPSVGQVLQKLLPNCVSCESRAKNYQLSYMTTVVYTVTSYIYASI